MKTYEPKKRKEGSPEVIRRTGDGVARPSRKASKPDAAASGEDGTGQENTYEPFIAEDRPFNPDRDVLRKTELLGWDVRPAHHKRRKIPGDPEEDPDNPEEA